MLFQVKGNERRADLQTFAEEEKPELLSIFHFFFFRSDRNCKTELFSLVTRDLGMLL